MKMLRKIASYGVLVLVLVGSVGVIWQRQRVGDWLVLRNYQTPADIQKLASDATLTSLGKHYFYLNKPRLEGRTAFNQDCTNQTEQAAVLGCYKGNRQGIYLYAITDNRLKGVEQTTAAHEMLHQAYDRLSPKEHMRIDDLLQDYYKYHLRDETVQSQLETYKKTEPNDLVNEMHSLFGTEIAHLPPALEAYYKQYFSDRSRVVAYNASYQAEFTQRKDKVAADDKQLAALKTQIETKQRDLDIRLSDIRLKKTQLDRESTANQIDAYNADVTIYNSLAQTYNQELAQTRDLVNQYNTLVEARNAIATQEQELQQALDSRLTPVGGQ
jgi:hypothetical protein